MASQRSIKDFFGKRKREETVETNLERSEIEKEISNPSTSNLNTLSDCESEDSRSTTATTSSTSTTTSAANDDVNSAGSSVEHKHSSKFDPQWKKTRPWLNFIPGSGMFCTVCQKYDKTPFGRDIWNKNPCKRLRLESVKKHEACSQHRDSEQKNLLAISCGDVGEQLSRPREIKEDSLVQAFQCLYFLCKNNIAHTTNFEKLLDLSSILGVEIKNNICKGANANYMSRTSIKEFLVSISDVLEISTIEELKSAQFFSLTFDETTDVSTIEQLVVHARMVDGDGKVSTKFLKVMDCLEGQEGEESGIRLTGAKVAERVTQYIEEKDLDYRKLIGLGTDGAAAMTGKDKGAVKNIVDHQVLQQAETETPCRAVGQHCSAHKLNLAASQAGNSFPSIERFKRTLKKVHEFYSRSAIRTKGLLAVQQLLSGSLEASGKVPGSSETRWLALGKCVIALRDILPSVLMSLEHESEERGDATAAGLLLFMTKLDFLLVLLLLCEVLPTVNRLSLTFQESLIDFSKIQPQVTGTINSLQAKKEAPSGPSRNVENLIQKIKDQAGITVEIEDEKIRKFEKNVKKPFIDKLTENITQRFVDNDIMQAFHHVLNKENYLDSNNHSKLSASVQKLVQQFGLSEEDTQAEIDDAVHYAPSFGPTMLKSLLAAPTCIQFPNLSALAKIYLCLPPHTADCERDFSRLKIIKNSLRNRMGEDSLDCLLRISITGPPIEDFPFAKAVKLWAQKKERRYKVKLT